MGDVLMKFKSYSVDMFKKHMQDCEHQKNAQFDIYIYIYIFFLIGIHTIQGWTATTRHGVTRKKSAKKIAGYRKSV